MIVVTGALGNLGSSVAETLLDREVAVRVADGNLSALADRYGAHVDSVQLDFWDLATYPSVLEGARSVFLVRPPAISRVKPTLNRFIDVAARHGVEHVVFSSVAGADTNRIVPHHRVEAHLTASDMAWTILRPGFFSQNIGTAYRRDITEANRIYVPAGDGRVAFIDARDVGEAAALALTNPDHRTRAYHLTGPEAVTFDEVAATLSDVLGRPIRYEPAGIPSYFRHLRAQGLVLPHATVQTMLHAGLRRGDAAPVTGTVAQLLGRPARTVRTYIEDNAELWQRPPP